MLAERLRQALLARVHGRPRRIERLLAAIRLVPLRPLRARLCRSLSWPLLDEVRAPVEVSTTAGRMVVDPVDLVGRVLTASGEWEPHVTHAFRRALGAGDVCLDLGAHVGYYTLLASKLVGPEGHVYAFEPAPHAYRELTANVARNAAANVTALNVAAGAEPGSAILHEGPGGSGNSSLSPRLLESPHAGRAESYTPVEVEVGRVDSLVPSEVFGRIRMIKVDVEGYEVEALRGVERILAEGARVALIVELSPEWSLEDPARFVEVLCERHGLRAFRLVNEYSLDGYFPARIERPAALDRIPAERCDLLLLRGAA